MINRDSDPPGGRTSPQSDHHGSEGGAQPKTKLFPFFIFYNLVVLGPSPPSDEIDRQHHIARQFARHHRLERLRARSARPSAWRADWHWQRPKGALAQSLVIPSDP